MDKAAIFTESLLKWAGMVDRPMPWKGEKNPYLIWLSEIILQQTRVEQGLSYYLKFKEKYPNIHDLAKAPEDEIFKLWEGLGYYSRARNLHFTAKYISNELDGIFPRDYKTILSLKGVGEYTAAAIASFAYDLSYAVLDGNVYRVLSRYFGIETPIDSTAGKKEFKQLSQNLLASERAAQYNQAIMDFGAIQCTPKKTQCATCPLQEKCTAFIEKKVDFLPVKSKKLKKRTRYFNFLILEREDYCFIQKRTAKDIWQDLYQFPLIETLVPVELTDLRATNEWNTLFSKEEILTLTSSKLFKQTLSHQKIIARFWQFEIPKDFHPKNETFIATKRENLSSFAFPKIIDWYFADKSLFLF